MSFHINSDKEKIRGVNPKLIGDNEVTIRSGTGSGEKEILRAQLDSGTNLPRVGINRTGQRVNNIDIDTAGSGYTVNPTVTIGAPNVAGGVQALASAFIFNGKVVSIAVNEPGSGYTTAPAVSITEGGGAGATATAVLDTVDFELDINGAIRTSTSIISDTARILNLDIDNFVTPNAAFRAPNLKTYANNTGTPWAPNVIIRENSYRYFGANMYQALNTGQTAASAPEHTDGIVLNNEVQFKHIGFRVNDPTEYQYNTSAESGEFPRSITPLLGDRSDKIATTEYVLNLATNDVGGRIYVSQQIGSDLNDGRSAVNPVRTIKKAAQEAWKTPGVKETIIVSGGDYVEDNPISLPPDCSVVGDNLRLVIIRPANPNKHIMKFGDKNYVIGVTYRDQIDSNGDPVATWDFAMVFDDKQRIIVDKEANGDFGTDFPVGHQIFGPQQFRVNYQQNTGLSGLISGLKVKGVNTGARAKIAAVTFAETTGASAYVSGTVDVDLISGGFVAGERFEYITSVSPGANTGLTVTQQQGVNTLRLTSDPTSTIPGGTVVQVVATPSSGNSFTGFYEIESIDSTQSASNIWDVKFFPLLNSPEWTGTGIGGTYTINAATPVVETFDTSEITSIRAEGEVVSVDEDYTTTLPISRIDFSLQNNPSIATGGFQSAQFGNAEDLGGIVFYTNALVGRTNTHEFKEGQEIEISGLPTSSPDLSVLNGKQRIYKVLEDADGRCRRFVIPKKMPSLTQSNYDPGQFAQVRNHSKVVTLSLLNSPNKFPLSSPVERRFQDACTFLRNNREFIADEVVGRINAEFARNYYSVYNISGSSFDIYLGQTTSTHTYVSGGTVTFGGTAYNVSGFLYDNIVTGVATVTTTSPVANLAEDNTIKLENVLLECDSGQKLYPAYSSPDSTSSISDGDEQCRQDVNHFINALIRDLEFGSNFNIIDAANKYVVDGDIAYIKDEIIYNVRAIEYARQLAILAMRNWRTDTGTTNDPIYVPRYSSLPRYFDDTVITSTALLNADGTANNTGFACNDVRAAIDTLAFLWVDVITKNQSGTYLDAAYLISRNKHLIADQALLDAEANYPLLNLSDLNERKCRRDIRLILDGLVKDLVFGGNEGVVNAAELYFTGTALTGVPEAQRPATIYAVNRAKYYAQECMRNWTDGNILETTPNTATYNAQTGALTVTIPDPTITPTTGDRIAFKEDALNWSCNYNGTTANHAGPSQTDPTYGKSHEITNVSVSGGSTTISCNVGNAGAGASSPHSFVGAITDATILIYNPTPMTSDIPKFEDWNILIDPQASAASSVFTPTNASYNTSNGNLELTVGSGHGVTTSDTVRITPESLVFTCDMDNDATEHSYPQSGQPVYGNYTNVTATSTSTITVNVGTAGTDKQWTPSAATYDPATGLLELTIGTGHGLTIDEGVVIADNSLSFTCTMDGNSSNKAYPRATDPITGKWLSVFNVDYNKLSINVGKSPLRKFTPTHVDYNPTTGFMTLTIGRHNLRKGTAIKIATNSIVLRCAQDNYATDHAYPRTTDPNYNTAVTITDVTDDTITVQTLASTPSTNTSNHIFVSATADSITTGGNYAHTFVSATSNGITRALLQTGGNYTHKFASGLADGVSTGGNYTHTFVSATSNGIDVAGDSVIISDNSLSFTCTKDGNATTHTYPRSTDPASAQVLPISAHTTDTFTVNVGVGAAEDQYTHTWTASNADAVTKVFYSLSDCSDVITTQNNLVSILTDTLNNAITTSPTDHLATVTAVSPAAEFAGARLRGFKEVPFPVSYHDAATDLIYTNQIDIDTQYRYRDAAYLIRQNASVIVDKTAYDMLLRYPDLALDMPRNANGTSTDGTLRCKTDLQLIVQAVANDIENGGNEKTTEAANFYLGNNNELRHIRLQPVQSIYAHDRLAIYIKQAITGDLTYDNTNDIITGDWDTPGNGVSTYFDAVKTEVDSLITAINDLIAPTNNDFNIAGDRLYFNRQYIAEEATGLTSSEFSYSLNTVQYTAFSYPGTGNTEVVRQANLVDIIQGMISDLQTGGNNSTITALETFLDSNLQIINVEKELGAFIYSISQVGVIGEYAINNRLYDFNSGFTAPDYAALKTDETAYRDTETPTDIATVVTRFKELVQIAVDFLGPAKLAGRSATKHILFNYNYYKEEITNQVNAQFGAGSWVYDTFITDITDDLVHDIIATDLTDKTTAYEITLTSNIGNYTVGEVIHSSNGAYAKVLEWNEDTSFLIVGPFTGTQWANGNTIVGRTSKAVGVVNAVAAGYDWYNKPTNVQTIAHARTLTSNITGQIAGANLFTNPEAIATDWTATEASIVNNSIAAPDQTITSEKIVPSTTTSLHTLNRDFNLNAFDTFDDGTIKFDATNQRFDEGSQSITGNQTFTFSAFVKAAGYTSIRFQMSLDEGTAAVQRIFFDLNLTAGTIGSVFTPQNGITNDASGVVPLGNGWYRAFITTTFSFGFTTLSNKIIINNAQGAQSYAGDGTSGIYVWGVKLTKTALDPYQSGDGTVFYSDNEYNIKQYAINTLQTYMQQALDNTLTEPSPNAGFYKFYDSSEAANYTTKSMGRLIRYNLDIIRNQIKTGTYYTQITSQNGITVPTKLYGARTLPIGLSGGLNNADYAYGLSSNVYGELESIIENSGKVVQVYQRFRIDGDITDGPYTMNETVQKQGNASVTGVVYGFFEDENYKYLDVKVTAGPWAITDNVVGANNSTTAQISAIENRLHVIDLQGTFTDNIPFKGYTSAVTAQPAGSFLQNEAAVTDNTGGTLTVDTATLNGSFEVNSVVYPESSRQYLDVIKYDGLDLKVGAKIASTGNIRFGISIISSLATFQVGNRLYKITSGVQDLNTYAIITGVDIPNNYIYAQEFQGTLTNGDTVGDYGVQSFPQGYASITTKVVTAGAATATVQDIKTVGTLKRAYLSDVVGTFDVNDAIQSTDNYKAAVSAKGDLKARVKRSFKGFDGVQTTFNLSQNNGTTYLPDPAGHLLIFINGILQPPGATNAYTAFSNQIQFTEAPDLGASFTGFYVGKLRQLDDISFEFDSLRQSFNLKRNDVFYSLTLTDGVQSSSIRPENNIICSLNGVIQEPGIGFEIVGSRIIFSEIPRFGSTFVAFSYVGSEADVDAAEIVPPVEPGDNIRIQGETEDRTVAVIESSNSLITFDYLGSVFGQDATATAALTTGFIKQVQVTSGGSSYTTRPTVRVDSISGFEGNIRALVGVGGVTMSNQGSGYQNPDIAVETVVPDNWTAPDLSQYGEEVVDPEIIT